MVLLEKAEVVSTYGDKMIRSVSKAFEMPKVIKLRRYINLAKNLSTIRYSRKNILIRDDNTCQYCAKRCTGKEATLDHVLPRSRGGGSSWTNIVLACRKCNGKKDNKTPKEAGMKLLKEPVKPKIKTFHKIMEEFGFSFDAR
jgi:5-methylcytosine-specific restriction endonuclease McrA